MILAAALASSRSPRAGVYAAAVSPIASPVTTGSIPLASTALQIATPATNTLAGLGR